MKITNVGALFFLFVLCSISIYGQNQDCSSATKLCEKGTFHFTQMEGIGETDESQESLLCSKNFKESNSHWLKWDIIKEGNLTFVLDPVNANDDLDFVLYKINFDCEDLEEIRCMASGRTFGDDGRNDQPCNGKTGLSLQSLDEFEMSGCKYNDDNYLKFLQTEVGEEYILFVNNFSSSEGFSITIEGTAAFRKYDKCVSSDFKDHLNITEIFPNPASDEISVVYNKSDSKPIDIQILNLQGQLVMTMQSTSIHLEERVDIEIEGLIPGTYLVRISQGEYSSTKRFIKQ